MDHMQGSRHRTRASEVLSRAALSNYHTIFSNLPPNQQAHMIYFTTKRLEEVRCRLCRQTLKYTELEEHIFSENHRVAIMTRLQKNRIARQEPLLYKAHRVYSADVDVEGETSVQTEVSVASSSSNSVTVDSSHTTINSSEDAENEDKTAEDEDKLVEDGVKLAEDGVKSAEDEDKPAEFKFNFSIPQEEESAVVEPESGMYRLLLCSSIFSNIIAAQSLIVNNHQSVVVTRTAQYYRYVGLSINIYILLYR